MKRIVWKVDKVLLAHWKGIDEAEKAKRDAEAKSHRQRGAKS